MQIRVMNENGINRFKASIEEISEGIIKRLPNLDTPEFSIEYSKQCNVIDSLSGFTTRMQFAQYMSGIFDESYIDRSEILGNIGFWTWLAYHWFEDLTPKVNDKLKPKKYYSYVYLKSYWRSYRHLVAAAYLIYSFLGEDYSKLFLQCNLTEHNDYVEQLASSGYIISNKEIIAASHYLYWDEINGRPKRGGQTRSKPGTLRRFTGVLGQFEMNYDIFTSKREDILSLLPKEFDKWKV